MSNGKAMIARSAASTHATARSTFTNGFVIRAGYAGDLVERGFRPDADVIGPEWPSGAGHGSRRVIHAARRIRSNPPSRTRRVPRLRAPIAGPSPVFRSVAAFGSGDTTGLTSTCRVVPGKRAARKRPTIDGRIHRHDRRGRHVRPDTARRTENGPNIRAGPASDDILRRSPTRTMIRSTAFGSTAQGRQPTKRARYANQLFASRASPSICATYVSDPATIQTGAGPAGAGSG